MQRRHVSGHKSSGINDILPEEILFNHIFSRLSPKTLLSCKSVCKSWNRVISDPHFVRQLLNRQQQPNLLAVDADNRFYSVDYGGGSSGEWLDLPAEAHTRRASVLGSHNGLVGMSLLIDHHINRTAIKFYLWNPWTGDSKLVPDPDPYIRTGEALGFGYDPNTDDYKFILVTKTDRICRMDMYSLRKKSWKIVNCAGRYDYYSKLSLICTEGEQCGVGVNGYIYFKCLIPDFIVGLCLRDYRMTELIMPANSVYFRGTIMVTGWDLDVFGNCLAVHEFEKTGNFVIWILRETRERKWEKMISFSLSSPENKCFWLFKPLWPTKEGKIVIFLGGGDRTQDQYNLGLFDLEKESMECVLPITGLGNSYLLKKIAHVHSFVSPNMF